MTKNKLLVILLVILELIQIIGWSLLVVLSISRYKNQKTKETPKVYTCIQQDIDTTYTKLYEDHECKRYRIGKNHSKKDELITIWDSKPRKTPKALALATAHFESSFLPNVFLQEKRYIIHKKDSLKYTDMGLFQCMGFTVPEVKKEIHFTIERQIEVYDSMMLWCLNKASWDIKKAIFYYNSPFGIYGEYQFVTEKFKLFKEYDKCN